MKCEKHNVELKFVLSDDRHNCYVCTECNAEHNKPVMAGD